LLGRRSARALASDVAVRQQPLGLITLAPPYGRVVIFRSRNGGPKTLSRESHPTDICALMTMPFHPQPIDQESGT